MICMMIELLDYVDNNFASRQFGTKIVNLGQNIQSIINYSINQ